MLRALQRGCMLHHDDPQVLMDGPNNLTLHDVTGWTYMRLEISPLPLCLLPFVVLVHVSEVVIAEDGQEGVEKQCQVVEVVEVRKQGDVASLQRQDEEATNVGW